MGDEVKESARSLVNVIKEWGEWDGGCFYYNGTAAPELAQAMLELDKALAAAS